MRSEQIQEMTELAFAIEGAARALRALDAEQIAALLRIVATIAAEPGVAVPEPDEQHRVEWAVLSDDGTVYEVEGNARPRAEYEARQLRTPGADGYVEPRAKVVERRVCTWQRTMLHDPPEDAPEP